MSNLGSRVFDAIYPGRCRNEECSGIREGDRVFYAKDEDTPQHVPGECHIVDPFKAKQPICPRCFIEMSVSGRCDNCD